MSSSGDVMMTQPPDACRDCDTRASVTSDLHKYQVACTCKPASVQYACAEEPGPPAMHKNPATPEENLNAVRKAADVPPALPPRPHNSHGNHGRRNQAAIGSPQPPNSASTLCTSRRKYGWWCVGCGALAALLGGLLAAAHILLRAYTSSPQHLETVPAAVPAAMLVLTGVCIMSLARRRNRYSYMIKVVGACCLVCALTCVLVTITTTVIHMNKLQTLRICEFTNRTRTCTCYSMPIEVQSGNGEDDSSKCVFEGVTGCAVVHGALYWCLRAIFALSVTAVLVCIFSCMLAYQLLSHERKKMYWEQLELRCRSLYRPPNPSSTITANRPMQTACSCCAQCHQTQSAWDISMQQRFWTPGRVGNLYSPNPGTVRKMSPWSWFPWPRNSNQRCRMNGVPQSHHPPSVGDSAYGFCETEANAQHYAHTYSQGSYGQQYAQGSDIDSSGGVWGPPPPYSPQSRGVARHHLHQDPATTTLLHHHIDIHRNSIQIHEHPMHSCSNRNSSYIAHLAHLQPELAHMQPEIAHIRPDLVHIHAEVTGDVGHLRPDVGHLRPEMVRMQAEVARLQSGELAHVRLQADLQPDNRLQADMGQLKEEGCHDRGQTSYRGRPYTCRRPQMAANTLRCDKQSTLQRQKLGKENLGFQNDVRASLECQRVINAESEVYFADVSSCCNVSLQTDCCSAKPNISSALVGTIENQLESTSGESDTGQNRQQHSSKRPKRIQAKCEQQKHARSEQNHPKSDQHHPRSDQNHPRSDQNHPRSDQNHLRSEPNSSPIRNELNIAATHERIDHLSSLMNRNADERTSQAYMTNQQRNHKASPINNKTSPMNTKASPINNKTSPMNNKASPINNKASPMNIIKASPLHPRQSSSESSQSNISLNYLNRLDNSFNQSVSRKHKNIAASHINTPSSHINTSASHINTQTNLINTSASHINTQTSHINTPASQSSHLNASASHNNSAIQDIECDVKCDVQYEIVSDNV